MEIVWVGLAALFAGFVDGVVGGGGLVLVPVLFAVYPSLPPATLFGTNKGGATWGTAASMLTYLRRVRPPWSAILPTAIAAFFGALLGAWAITRVHPGDFRKLLPFILAALLVYTLWRKDLGHTHAPTLSGGAERTLALGAGLLIGFYDGFFGPGTGNFLVFLFVRGFGFDFLHASAGAKAVNVSTNLAALALFAAKGHVLWPVAALVAVLNIAGNLLGARVALRGGTRFVRSAFIVVVVVLIGKTAWDGFFR